MSCLLGILTANTTQELKSLICKADKWIKDSKGIQEFDFNNERELFKLALSSITSHKLVGIDLVLRKSLMILGLIKYDLGVNLRKSGGNKVIFQLSFLSH